MVANPIALTRARLFQAEMRSLRCEMWSLGKLDTGSVHAKFSPLIIPKIKSWNMRSPSCAHMVKRWPGLPMLIASLLGTCTTSHNPLLQNRYGPEAWIGGSWAIAVHRVRGFLWWMGTWRLLACAWSSNSSWPLVGIGHHSKKLKLIIGQIHANAMVLGPCQKLTKLLLIFRAPRHDDYFESKWKLSTVRSYLLLKFWTPGMLHMQHALYTQIAGK